MITTGNTINAHLSEMCYVIHEESPIFEEKKIIACNDICAIGMLVYCVRSQAIIGNTQCNEIPVIQFDMVASQLS